MSTVIAHLRIIHRFLLARLHFDSLTTKTTIKSMRLLLSNLRKGTDALSKAYEQALERIDGQVEDHRLLANRVLSWLTFAKEPLEVECMQQALAAVLDMTSVDDEEDLVDLELMLSVCAGLVIVDEQTQAVRLIHYTTQEFLEQNASTWLVFGDRIIGMVCLDYMRLAGEAWPFADYAVKSWGRHLRKYQDDQDTAEFVLKCLDTRSKWDYFPTEDETYITERAEGYTLHLLASFDLHEIGETFLQGLNDSVVPATINQTDEGYGRTPLLIAAIHNCANFARMLLTYDSLDVNCADEWGYTPLHIAASSGNTEVLQALLHSGRKLDFDKRAKFGRTALHQAVIYAKPDIVELLLPHCDTALKDDLGDTLLHKAMVNKIYRTKEIDHVRIIELLLQKPETDVNAKHDYGGTALHIAAEEGDMHVLDLLLSHKDVEVDVINEKGESPLHWAAYAGHLDVVKLLLPRSDVERPDSQGRTPLHIAARRNHAAVVEHLLSCQAGLVNVPDRWGETPLQNAAERGRLDVVKLLIPLSNLEHENQLRENALDLAIGWEHEEVAEVLRRAMHITQ